MEDPKPLVEGTVIDRFVPDATLSWRVAYVGPIENDRRELFSIPMIGWLQVAVDTGIGAEVSFVMRPAIMTSNGRVSDYLDQPENFTFLGVLRDGPKFQEQAHQLFVERGLHRTAKLGTDSPTLPTN